MDKSIHAIETIYDGYRFRSRLEARWAVFFNIANIQYQYEPEGFKTMQIYDPSSFGYLPDFYLPKWDIYAEVKPTDDALAKDAGKLADVIDYHATPIANKGLLLLGNIPYCEHGFPVFNFLFWHKGVACGWALFDIWDKEPELLTTGYMNSYKPKGDISLYGLYDSMNDYGEPIPQRASVAPRFINYDNITICSDSHYINMCYSIARQARFEHGEVGA